jgi:hypothetical protein
LNAYPVTITGLDGSIVQGELVTDVTLTTDFWTISPAGNGVLYSGGPPSVVWVAIPNYLNESAAVSVNIKTTYITTPANGAGVTLTISGSLPTGWTFDGTTLAYDGTSIAGPNTISFNSTLSGLATASSNSFQVQGVGTPSTDTVAPIVPVGTAIQGQATSSQVVIGGITPSDPNQSAHTWSGLQQINVTRTPPGSVIGHTTIGPGNQPILTFADIGPQSSTITQTNADVAFTTVAKDNPYPTVDCWATAFQQITGTSWTASIKVSSFVSADGYSNVGLYARAAMGQTAAFVGILTFPFSQGNGVLSKARSALGGNDTNIASAANAASPIWLILNRSGDTYSFYYSTDGNTLLSLGTQTQAMGSTIYVGPAATTDDGVSISVTAQQISIQTLANWSYTDNTVSASTSYTYSVTAQDSVPNISAAGATISIVTPSASPGITFNPGLYKEESSAQAGYGGAWNPAFQDLPTFGAEPAYVKGLCSQFSWGNFEQSKGVYDFTLVDYFINQLAGINKQAFLYIRYECIQTSTVSNAFNKQYYPAYLNDAFGANVYGGALPIYFGSSLGGSISCIERPAVMNAFIAMLQAMANHTVSGGSYKVKDHPNLEGIFFVETSYNLTGTTNQTPQPNWPYDNYGSQSSWYDAYHTQYNILGTAARQAFPNKFIGRRANWGTNAQMLAIMSNSITNALGLDNTDGVTDYCNMDDCIRGIMPGSTDVRNSIAGNKIPLFCFSESVGTNNGGFNITGTNMVSLAKDPTQWCANYLIINRYPGNPWVNSTWAQIKTAYNNQGGNMQTVKPQTYP